MLSRLTTFVRALPSARFHRDPMREPLRIRCAESVLYPPPDAYWRGIFCSAARRCRECLAAFGGGADGVSDDLREVVGLQGFDGGLGGAAG